ncbi:MAG: hypothetical protein HQ546_01655, partial [Planctomycetes bacterium]|nr:hypothetical protein [Planctomycetota bacterium]
RLWARNKHSDAVVASLLLALDGDVDAGLDRHGQLDGLTRRDEYDATPNAPAERDARGE